MTDEERKYKIFKIFYHNCADKKLIEDVEKSIIKSRFINRSNYYAMETGKIANDMYFLIKKNKSTCSEILYYYNNIIHNISVLSEELDLKKSLELCMLYSHLLWNGYLSKNKEYKFSSNGIKRIPGLFFADIIEGKGVCLSNSHMLKDLLVSNEYNSVLLETHYNLLSKNNYNIDITSTSEEVEKRILTIAEEIIKYRKANHVFNLIEDNNNMYIFDSTNLTIHKIIDKYHTELITGKGSFKIFPYQSYMLAETKKETELLDKLITSEDYDFLYTKFDIIAAVEVCLEIIKNNLPLIEEFYIEMKQNITEISKEVNKIRIISK